MRLFSGVYQPTFTIEDGDVIHHVTIAGNGALLTPPPVAGDLVSTLVDAETGDPVASVYVVKGGAHAS